MLIDSLNIGVIESLNRGMVVESSDCRMRAWYYGWIVESFKFRMVEWLDRRIVEWWL